VAEDDVDWSRINTERDQNERASLVVQAANQRALDALPFLRRALDDDGYYYTTWHARAQETGTPIKAIVINSLSRLNDRDSIAKINELHRASDNSEVRVAAILALLNFGEIELAQLNPINKDPRCNWDDYVAVCASLSAVDKLKAVLNTTELPKDIKGIVERHLKYLGSPEPARTRWWWPFG
jgi:HEAT repeat protein